MSHIAPLIVIADSDTVYLDLMNTILAEAGYTVLRVSVSGQVYPLVRQAQPNLVIMDIQMGQPDSGWYALDLIRLDPDTASIPLLVCSTNTFLFQRRLVLLKLVRWGTLDKPFVVDQLLAKITELLH